MWASAMFDEIPNKPPYNSKTVQHRSPVRGFDHMLELFSVVVAEVAPAWETMDYSPGHYSLVGVPFEAILNWPMGTPSGHAFFLEAEVNAKVKRILDTWRDQVLKTRKSLTALTRNKDGWLCEAALEEMENEARTDDGRGHDDGHGGKGRLRFQDVFECDPEGDPVHWGFTSWDDFCVRQFRNMDQIRPVAHPDRPEWVANVCEARPVVIQPDIKEYDTFWIKGQDYSVAEMLQHHPLAHHFIGGTAFQSVLKQTAYHRWTSPVSGHVVHVQPVKGTYFSERQTYGSSSGPLVSPLMNQVYLSHIAARTIIYIEAEPPVDIMCFVAIGMADVSTCEVSKAFDGDVLPRPVKKGEELGMFHYGGSSICLLFRKGLRLAWVDGAIPGASDQNLAVRSALAMAYKVE